MNVEVIDVPLSLAKSYVSSWGIRQAVRELIQNALDCEDYDISVGGGKLYIHSFNGCLSIKHLLLGCGAKSTDGSTRGGHGEGLAVSLLVLARKGVDITFINGNEKWVPYLKYNETFHEECLHLRVEPWEGGCEESVLIEIDKLGLETEDNFLEPTELDYIIEDNLVLQTQDYSSHETEYGEILLEPQHKGKIFCGGLYVQSISSFKEGFNFKPEYLSLDRDRRMVSTFDIQWITKEMWGEISKDAEGSVAEYLVDSLVTNSESTQFLHHSNERVSDQVKEKVLEVYKEKYDGKLLTESYEEKEKLLASGNDNADYIGNTAFLRILDQTEEYQLIKSHVKVEKPVEWLDTFKEKYYDEMSSEMLFDFEDLCSKLEKIIK